MRSGRRRPIRGGAIARQAGVRRHRRARRPARRTPPRAALTPPVSAPPPPCCRRAKAQKALAVASTLYDRLADLHADRRTLVVAVGGGVIGDLAGFVAATFNRGLPLLMVPTTLLAMVDSSVGGKVGVNHPKAKNLIGAFHQPVGVWIDTASLDTLARPRISQRPGRGRQVRRHPRRGVLRVSGGTHADAILQREPAAVRHVVARCCRLKADVVRTDEREETGLRAVLNYGHTFAHAFETAAGYGTWLHGEAVAAGMVCASRWPSARGLVPAELTRAPGRPARQTRPAVAPESWDRGSPHCDHAQRQESSRGADCASSFRAASAMLRCSTTSRTTTYARS